MLNTYYNSQKLSINAVSGILTKTYTDSFFLRFHIRSQLSDELFNVNPKYRAKGTYVDKDIIILQTMLCAENQLIAEVIYKEDFNKLISTIKEDNQ